MEAINRSIDKLSKNELLRLQKTQWIGKQLEYFDVIDSTNTTAMRIAKEGAIHGTLVVADRQDSGKGRRGRKWETPSGVAIAMTLLLKPRELAPSNAPMLTLVSALAVAKAIEHITGAKSWIKWPNDIVIDGKKICGILTEMSTQKDAINHIAVGIGINVNNTAFDEELVDKATSIRQITGKEWNRAVIVESVCEYFEQYYEVFMRTQDLSVLMEEYNNYLVNRGKPVRVLDPKKEFEGRARGITDRGELLVDTEEGTSRISSGEVSVRGIYNYV